MSKKKTLLVIAPSSKIMHDCVFHILVAETGEHLASHLCSNSSFAYDDLYATRKDRIEEWTKRFGKVDVKFIDETNITEKELKERNKKWFEKSKEQKVKK